MCFRDVLLRAKWGRTNEETFAPHRPEQPVSAHSSTLHSAGPVSPHTQEAAAIPDSLEDDTASIEASSIEAFSDSPRSGSAAPVSQPAAGPANSGKEAVTPDSAASSFSDSEAAENNASRYALLNLIVILCLSMSFRAPPPAIAQ